jgi:hypothetical protein
MLKDECVQYKQISVFFIAPRSALTDAYMYMFMFICMRVIREKKIQDLEARNAELKQQLWMVEAEVDTLRYRSFSSAVCGVL